MIQTKEEIELKCSVDKNDQKYCEIEKCLRNTKILNKYYIENELVFVVDATHNRLDIVYFTDA